MRDVVIGVFFQSDEENIYPFAGYKDVLVPMPILP